MKPKVAKMGRRAERLDQACKQIFQGLIPSADSAYHLWQLAPGRYYSAAAKGEVFPFADHKAYGTKIKNELLEYLKSAPIVAMVQRNFA